MKQQHRKLSSINKILPEINSSLDYLKLPFIQEHYQPMAQEAAQKQWSHIQYLSRLLEGEALAHQDKRTLKRIQLARFPLIKTLDQFQWNWPSDINQLQIQNLFQLHFLEQHANIIFLGGVGLGKTHLSIALGHHACLNGYCVLFTTAINVINALLAAAAQARLAQELRKFLKPNLLILDELGYLPIDKPGADLLFQVISHRYEQGSLIITSNRPYKKWTEIFNNDATLTSALLDRLLHHSDTVTLSGKSFRMKDKLDP